MLEKDIFSIRYRKCSPLKTLYSGLLRKPPVDLPNIREDIERCSGILKN